MNSNVSNSNKIIGNNIEVHFQLVMYSLMKSKSYVHTFDENLKLLPNYLSSSLSSILRA
jgi:hypothetical protein